MGNHRWYSFSISQDNNIYRIVTSVFRAIRRDHGMYCNARKSNGSIKRIWIPYFQGSKSGQCSHGERTHSGRQNSNFFSLISSNCMQIDPKRAIPREEQDRTSKIFVGGIGQDVVEEEFKAYFEQFGTVLDATLMMDKETGRPRGFGFVTFDDDSAVENCLAQGPLAIKGKMVS